MKHQTSSLTKPFKGSHKHPFPSQLKAHTLHHYSQAGSGEVGREEGGGSGAIRHRILKPEFNSQIPSVDKSPVPISPEQEIDQFINAGS